MRKKRGSIEHWHNDRYKWLQSFINLSWTILKSLKCHKKVSRVGHPEYALFDQRLQGLYIGVLPSQSQQVDFKSMLCKQYLRLLPLSIITLSRLGEQAVCNKLTYLDRFLQPRRKRKFALGRLFFRYSQTERMKYQPVLSRNVIKS